MSITPVQTDQAPAAIGPYSQAVVVDKLLFVSGQIPLDPATGEIVEGGAPAQARRVLDSLTAVIEAAGGSMTQVAKVTIYLTSMDDFAAVNQIYAEYFSEPFPARACVAVTALPKGVDVEMDAIVSLP